MLTLYICRHAKSSWDNAGLSDFDRPLNSRGERDAPLMGTHFATRGERVDLIRSSPANRAITTARIIANTIGYDPDNIEQDQSMYHAGANQIIQLVNALPSDVLSVMFFGHNPGYTDICNRLADAGLDNMPTCGQARIDFDLESWSLVSAGTGELVWLDYPKAHNEMR